jgi:hypothetical protein
MNDKYAKNDVYILSDRKMKTEFLCPKLSLAPEEIWGRRVINPRNLKLTQNESESSVTRFGHFT